MLPKPIVIKAHKLLLAEGADACNFLIWAYQAWGAADIQVLDFGGVQNRDLPLYLRQLQMLSGFDDVKTLVVARDAERNANGAVTSMIAQLTNTGLPAPMSPFTFTTTPLRVAYMIFPGYAAAGSNGVLENGTLEDLCLKTIADDPVMPCVGSFLRDVQATGEPMPRPHKSSLYTYLAGKQTLTGLKLGEAARVGAWPWDHPAFAPYRDTVRAM
jgi:hypothetical protein